jgi:hypothetical protein
MEFGIFLGTLFAAMFAPFLLSLLSANVKAMLLTLSCSVLTVLLSTEDYWSVIPWTIGMLIAVIAIYNRFAEAAHTPSEPDARPVPIAVVARPRRRS